MKKRLHFLFGLLLLTLSTSAQLLSTGGRRLLPTLPASRQSSLTRYEQLPRFGQQTRFAPRRAITVDPDRQMWWGYYPDSLISEIGLGCQKKEIYWAAIGIPSSASLPQGKSIKAVRFIVDGAAGMKDFHLWIADRLPKSLSEVAVDMAIDSKKLVTGGFTEVELPTAYAIPAGKTLYLGYTFEVEELVDGASYPLIIRYNGADISESLWVNIPSVTSNQWTDEFKSYGPLAIQALLDGDFPHNAVSVSKTFLDVFAIAEGKADATVTLTSQGLGAVKSIDYIVGDANADSDEQHLEVEPFEGIGAERQVRIPLKADASVGRTPRYITVTKVNGVENAIDNATSEGYLVTLDEAVPRRTVVEEFTGTWCGWCPRGIVGMEKVNEQFGDKAITIVVHGDDPMSIDYGTSAGSYPMAYVDRAIAADPYYGITGNKPAGICDLVADRNALLAEARVSLQQPTLAKNGTIKFNTEVTFLYDNSTAPYAIGYVLLQDGLKGTGRDWAQANYYSGRYVNEDGKPEIWADDALLKPWLDGAAYVTGMTFDHVAIAAKGMDGSGGGFTAPIKKDIVRNLSGTLSINENAVLQGTGNLKVVAVVFNTETGYIVNADIQPVQLADDFSQNRMQIKAFEQTGALKGEAAKVVVPVANFGSNGVRNIDYVVREGLEESDTLHIDLPKPITSFGVYENVEIPLPAHAESGLASVTIVITKVNGAENEATSGKSAKGNVLTVAQKSKRRTVVEEFTGTWCGYCPRGMVGLQLIQTNYPDDAVIMAIHGGRDNEPMKVTSFSTQLGSVSGFPSAHVNRYLSCDPYLGNDGSGFGIASIIENENSQMVEASVELHQPTLEKSTSVIDFTTDVTFQINRKSAPYLLSYVLVGDGITGEGDDWTQVNYYPALAAWYADDPDLGPLCDMESAISNMVYDHVAVAGLGVDNGVSNSLKTTVEEGQVQSHTSKFSIKNNALAKKATKLRVIAMLYDKTRKVFINADEKEVVEVDAVEDVLDGTPSATPSAVYNLAGQRLAAPRRGINIIDGKKVLVK